MGFICNINTMIFFISVFYARNHPPLIRDHFPSKKEARNRFRAYTIYAVSAHAIYAGWTFEMLTLWSYHFPLVPIRAMSNSSSITETGISKAFTVSV